MFPDFSGFWLNFLGGGGEGEASSHAGLKLDLKFKTPSTPWRGAADFGIGKKSAQNPEKSGILAPRARPVLNGLVKTSPVLEI